MLNDSDVDFASLKIDQVCNQFEGIHQLATKQGLCDLSKEGSLINQDMNDIMPRSYNLGDPTHRDEFIDDFRLTAAVNILKHHFLCRLVSLLNDVSYFHSSALSWKAASETLLSIPVSPEPLRHSLKAALWHIKLVRDGEWPTIDNSAFFSGSFEPLSDEEWHSVTQLSYAVSQKRKNDLSVDQLLRRVFRGDLADDFHLLAAIKRQFTPFDYRVREVLLSLSRMHRQFFIDGFQNLWVGKSPDSSCGIGIRLFHKLEDILDFERGMSGRTIQKYIETPLLSHPAGLYRNPAASNGCKFDLRIWVVVTQFEPQALQAHIYNVVYGRRCGHPFSLDLAQINNHFVHLTNYSVQKKKFAGASAVGAYPSDSGSTTPRKHSIVQRMRSFRQPDPSGGDGPVDVPPDGDDWHQSDLLMSFSEIRETVDQSWMLNMQQGVFVDKSVHQALLDLHMNDPDADIWGNIIWPRIRWHIDALLQCAAYKITPRDQSLQFLGFDVLLDETLYPWVLEVNMSPAMAHRSDEQSTLIKSMARQLVSLAVVPKLPVESRVDVLNVLEYGDGFQLNPSYGRWQPLRVPSEPSPIDESSASTEPFASSEASTSSSRLQQHPLYPRYRPSRGDVNGDRNSHQRLHRPPPSSSKATSRPKSASAVGRIRHVPADAAPHAEDDTNITRSSSNAQRGATGLDIGFTLCGRAIGRADVLYIDYLHSQLQSIVRLQRRTRLFLFHCRRWHFTRHAAAVKLQCWVRCWQAKATLQQLRRVAAAVVLQCLARRLLSRRSVRIERLSMRVQTRVLPERRLLRTFSRWWLCYLCRVKRRLQRWLMTRWRSYKWRHLRRVLWIGKWCRRYRLRCARRVYLCVRLHWRRSRARQRRLRHFFIDIALPIIRAEAERRKAAVAELLATAKAQALALLRAQNERADAKSGPVEATDRTEKESDAFHWEKSTGEADTKGACDDGDHHRDDDKDAPSTARGEQAADERSLEDAEDISPEEEAMEVPPEASEQDNADTHPQSVVPPGAVEASAEGTVQMHHEVVSFEEYMERTILSGALDPEPAPFATGDLTIVVPAAEQPRRSKRQKPADHPGDAEAATTARKPPAKEKAKEKEYSLQDFMRHNLTDNGHGHDHDDGGDGGASRSVTGAKRSKSKAKSAILEEQIAHLQRKHQQERQQHEHHLQRLLQQQELFRQKRLALLQEPPPATAAAPTAAAATASAATNHEKAAKSKASAATQSDGDNGQATAEATESPPPPSRPLQAPRAVVVAADDAHSIGSKSAGKSTKKHRSSSARAPRGQSSSNGDRRESGPVVVVPYDQPQGFAAPGTLDSPHLSSGFTAMGDPAIRTSQEFLAVGSHLADQLLRRRSQQSRSDADASVAAPAAPPAMPPTAKQVHTLAAYLSQVQLPNSPSYLAAQRPPRHAQGRQGAPVGDALSLLERQPFDGGDHSPRWYVPQRPERHEQHTTASDVGDSEAVEDDDVDDTESVAAVAGGRMFPTDWVSYDDRGPADGAPATHDLALWAEVAAQGVPLYPLFDTAEQPNRAAELRISSGAARRPKSAAAAAAAAGAKRSGSSTKRDRPRSSQRSSAKPVDVHPQNMDREREWDTDSAVPDDAVSYTSRQSHNSRHTRRSDVSYAGSEITAGVTAMLHRATGTTPSKTNASRRLSKREQEVRDRLSQIYLGR